MKLTHTFAAIVGAAALLSSSSLTAGTVSFKEEVIIETEPTQWWNADLSTGWDSLYMFRGVNLLPDFQGYGSSLYWTDLSVTFNLTENDSLTIGSWLAFGLGDTNYKELDVYAAYTRSFGDFELSLGYVLYAILSAPGGLYSNEVFIDGNYTFELGAVSITPGISYFFNVGPAPGNGGFASQASSFLQPYIVTAVPLIGDVVGLELTNAFGTNFRYNAKSNGNIFNGGNNYEIILALPVTVTENISFSPYVAYSYQWQDLVGTEPSTFWGGGSVSFSF